MEDGRQWKREGDVAHAGTRPGDGVKLQREDRGINKGMLNVSGSETENLENRGKVMNLGSD